MEGEWGPTDNGSSVADDPLHLHIAHLNSGSWAEEMVLVNDQSACNS